MLQLYNHEMDTINIMLHWIAHFRDQVNKTEARARSNARGRGQLVEAEAEAVANMLASRPVLPRCLNITGMWVCLCVHWHDKTKTPDRNDLRLGTVDCQ